MVKKLRCDVDPADWVRIVKYGEAIAVQVNVGGEKTDIFLTHSDAKKLRKQIKKALIEIDGELEDDIPAEKEEPAYIPHIGEVVEVYRNTVGHVFEIGQKVRAVEVKDGRVKAESLNSQGHWWVGGDIRPIQKWEPKEGEKVLIVDSTFVPSGTTLSWIGKFGYIRWDAGDGEYAVWNEDKSDWFCFNFSDLRPAE